MHISLAPPVTWINRTAVAMTMHVELGLLHVVDHICHSLDILFFVGWYPLNALILPTNVFPVRHGLLVRCLV